jgi:hypothetical protein
VLPPSYNVEVSQMLITLCQATGDHDTEDHILYIYHCDNLKFHILIILLQNVTPCIPFELCHVRVHAVMY